MAVLMTVELANKLLALYKECNTYVCEMPVHNTSKAKSACAVREADMSLSYCARVVFKEAIYSCDAVVNFESNRKHPVVLLCRNFIDVMYSLDETINFLETFINQKYGCINDSGIGE